MWSRFKNWFVGLSRGGKIALVGIVVVIGLIGSTANKTPVHNSNGAEFQPSSSKQVMATPSQKAPAITTKTITQEETIQFESQTQNDATLDAGKTVVVVAGVNGVKTKTYEVTYSDGTETSRILKSEAITTPPVTQISHVGTKVAIAPKVAQKPAASCDPNYSGACVPIASDVDCAGGSGNGPAYVAGPVYVIGSDIYDLDRDGNGVACQ